jgi:hypothetical protein
MKYLLRALAGVPICLLISQPAISLVDEEIAATISIACERLLADYVIYRDHLDADGFANTFTENGELVLGSGSHVGREAIRRNITGRPTPGVAHMILMTTIKITPVDETNATGVSYALVLNGDRPVVKGDAPIQMRGITAAVEYHTEFVLTNDGWKISRLELKSIFRGPGIA